MSAIQRPGRLPPPRASRSIFSDASSSFRFVVTMNSQYMRTLYGGGPSRVAPNGERRKRFGEGRRRAAPCFLDISWAESYGDLLVAVPRLTPATARW